MLNDFGRFLMPCALIGWGLLSGANPTAQAQTLYTSVAGIGPGGANQDYILDYSLAGGQSSESQLWAAPLNINLGQMAISGGNIYVSYLNGNLPSNGQTGGIYEVPLAGGTPTIFQEFLNQPTGLAVFGGNLYVADYSANTVEEFPLAGGSPTLFASSGLDNPESMVISGGNLYVANDGNSTIEEFSLSVGNASATQFASTGLDGPFGLAISNGNLYAANITNNTIEEFSLSVGNASATQFANTGLNYPLDLASDGVNLYSANFVGGNIEEFSESGGSPTQFATTGNSVPIGLVIAVPEPTSYAMLAIGLGLLLWLRRSREMA